MESREIDAGLRYQGSQTCNEIHRIEGHLGCPMPKAFAALMGQAFPVGRLASVYSQMRENMLTMLCRILSINWTSTLTNCKL